MEQITQKEEGGAETWTFQSPEQRQPSFAASPLLKDSRHSLHFQLFILEKQTVINIYQHVCGVFNSDEQTENASETC